MTLRRALAPFLAALAAACLSAMAAHGQALTPQEQALLDQVKKEAQQGKMPTAAELKALQQIGQSYQTHFGSVAGGTKPIPCKVTFTMHCNFSGSSKTTHTTYSIDMSGSSSASMAANVNGTADWAANIKGKPASSFIVTPKTDGTGSYHLREDQVIQTDQGQRTTWQDTGGSISQGAAGLMLVTTGGDALYGRSGYGGTVNGTQATYDSFSKSNDNGKPKPGSYGTNWRDVNPGLTDETHNDMKPNKPLPKPKINLSYKALVAAIASGKQTTITGNEGFSFPAADGTVSGCSTVSITLNPSAITLVVEPDDEAGYEKWLPLPGTDDNKGFDFKGTTPLNVHICLSDSSKPGAASGTGKTKPNSDVAGKFDIYLHDTSNNPGVCMNFPVQGTAPNLPGLYFPKTQPNGIVYDDDTHVHTASPVLEAEVIVNVRDTAAYGQLEAKCTDLNLDSQVLRTGKPSLDIPMDDDSNHIADYWQKQNPVSSTDAGWDDVDKPSGMLTGDGISLFDKYRGLLIDDGTGTEVFSRVDPTVINLFIYLPGAWDVGPNPQGPIGPTPGFPANGTGTKADFMAGCNLYARATGIKVNFIHSSDRLLTIPPEVVYPRWFTFNQTQYTKTKMCAVVIFDDGKGQDKFDDGTPHIFSGTTMGTDPAQDTSRRDPTQISHILVRLKSCLNQVNYFIWILGLDPAANPTHADETNSMVKYAKAMNADPAQIIAYATAHKQSLIDSFAIFSLCHELGHATGAMHHDPAPSGDWNCPMRYWQADPNPTAVLLFMMGKWDPSISAPDHSWQFCTADWPSMRVKPQ